MIKKQLYFILSSLVLFFTSQFALAQDKLPDTGISGVYEVITAAKDPQYAIKYFGEFGFTVIDSVKFSASKSNELYGVNSNLTSYRLQNGNIDSHGLLRIWVWEQRLGDGVGYAPPETIGQRMAVMKTEKIIRIYDTYVNARDAGGKWLPTEPIADDLFGLNKGEKDFFKRPVLVRENAVWGEFFNHVFFQRYGYHIEGYGTANQDSPLKTSEFTHHDFIITTESMEDLSYLSSALGLKAEKEPEIDGDWLKGPKRVFVMSPGDSHWYQGFVSPNNICGKLKFFIPRGNKADLSQHQRIGELGITLHSFYTPKLQMIYDLVTDHKFDPTKILENEFGEKCFVFRDKTGVSWQIIEKMDSKNKPVTELKFELTDQ